MSEFTAESLFDFEGATEDDRANEVEFAKTKTPCNLFRDPDQYPQAYSSMSTEPIEQADPGAVNSESSETIAPPPTTDLPQQCFAPSLRSQDMGTGPFSYRESTAPYQPILQQQLATAPQANIQQQQPVPAPATQSTDNSQQNHKKPPMACQLHTKMYEQGLFPPPPNKNLEARLYTPPPPWPSSSPITQQEAAPLPPNLSSHQRRQTLRPHHSRQQRAHPYNPRPHQPRSNSAQIPPQQHQKTPTTTTTKKKSPGRKHKDHDKTGFLNTTLPRHEHTDTTKWGRNSLRGANSRARMAEPYNQPCVKRAADA